MSIKTHSMFYYGHTVDETNYAIDFNEGASELNADLAIGSYTPTEYAAEIARVLNLNGSLTYTVTFNRTTRKITIAATGTFSLLVSSGTRVGSDPWSMIGFSGSDKTAAATYTGSAVSGSVYNTQFIIQSYVASSDNSKPRYPTVNISASGQSEIFKFGDDLFFDMQFMYVTDLNVGSTSPVRYQSGGHTNFLALMNYLITKAPVEFMPDEATVGTFYKVILEKTPDESTGGGFKLHEMYSQKLPGFFDSGILTMRDLT